MEVSFEIAIRRVTDEIPVAEVWNTVFGSSYPVDQKIQVRCSMHGDGEDDTGQGSARLYPDSNRAWCWGCSRIRDNIDIVREGLEKNFREAVDYLLETFLKDVRIFGTETIAQKVEWTDNWLSKRLEFLESLALKGKKKLGLKRFLEICFVHDYVEAQKSLTEDEQIRYVARLERKILGGLSRDS